MGLLDLGTLGGGVLGVVAFFSLGPFLAFGAGFSDSSTACGELGGVGTGGATGMLRTSTMAFSEGGVIVRASVGAASFGGDRRGEFVTGEVVAGELEDSQTASMSSRVLLPLPSSFCCFRKSNNVRLSGSALVAAVVSSKAGCPSQSPTYPS